MGCLNLLSPTPATHSPSLTISHISIVRVQIIHGIHSHISHPPLVSLVSLPLATFYSLSLFCFSPPLHVCPTVSAQTALDLSPCHCIFQVSSSLPLFLLSSFSSLSLSPLPPTTELALDNSLSPWPTLHTDTLASTTPLSPTPPTPHPSTSPKTSPPLLHNNNNN